MKLRAAVSVLAIASALTACSSSSNGNGSTSTGAVLPTTGGTGVSTAVVASGGGTGAAGDFCAKLTDANSKLSTIGGAASGGDFGALKAAIDQEVAAFQELGNGAPAEVKPAIDDIVTVLQAAGGAFANPGSPDIAKLQGLATKLPADVTVLANYLGTKCTGS